MMNQQMHIDHHWKEGSMRDPYRVTALPRTLTTPDKASGVEAGELIPLITPAPPLIKALCLMNSDPQRASRDNEATTADDLDSLDPFVHIGHSETNPIPTPDDSVIPQQQHSVQNETVDLKFPSKRDPSRPAISLTLSISAKDGCGGVTWEAGEVLANYLVNRISSVSGKNVVELGSGTGLVGLVAARLGGQVWITDQAPMLDIMRRNVSVNNLQSIVTVAQLDWLAHLHASIRDLP
ncbi:hypothetical protein HGRIS_009887 [Hohenbuehelia grisea]|uniref:Uncharacterized protein n=1 Tax=Hohenbuehelia grisea TaxID=104357 RepID=A0ABR3J2X1_9AGAR